MAVIFKCDKCGKEDKGHYQYAHGWEPPDGWHERWLDEQCVHYCPECLKGATDEIRERK